MMSSKSILTSDIAEQTRAYHHASHIARALLTSNAKHSDLPIVMHAHACMVLGCSDENDCIEMMENALTLVRQAVEEGLLGEREGTEMVRCCEVTIGMREQEMELDAEYDESGSGSWSDGEGGEERFELP
jgi:hypothetical protein